MMGSKRPPTHTCPWWLLFTFDNPLRRLVHNPSQILLPFVEPGETVLDVGCGMGYFSLPMAQLVGENGHVLAVDLQPQMLDGLRKRARRAGLADRIESQLCTPDELNVTGPFHFALAFWMVHEAQNPTSLLEQIHQSLVSGGQLLLVEPKVHVSRRQFESTIAISTCVGFEHVGHPPVKVSWSALFIK